MHDATGVAALNPARRILPTMPSASSPTPSGVLGFDFGERYIGVAVGDTETRLAHALEFIDAEANEPRFARIAALIAEWRPSRLVVGLPLGMDGEEHDMTRRARRFARQLEGRFSLPVLFCDERLSSAEAEAQLRERGRAGREHKNETHALAAQLVLQAWLDAEQT